MKEKANINSYLIESLAPLVFRAGKPFGSKASAQDVIFPLPSAAAGLLRYLHLSQNTDGEVLHWGKAKFEQYKQEVLNIQSFGPFLVKFSNENNIQILVPKPADALYLDEKDDKGELTDKTLLVRLEPRAFDGENEQCGSDLPDNLLHIQIEPKFEHQQGKPAKGASFWRLDDFIQWQKGETLSFDTVNDNGLTSIPTELRTHVAIDDDKLTSADGMLFQTASFDLLHKKTDDGWEKERLGFLVQTTKALKADLATFGGERRLSHIKPVKNINLPFIPTQDTIDKINQNKGFSLAFITPCIFEKGALPAWIDKDSLTGTIPETGIKVQLKAMAIDRWQAVSGWDSVLWQPKATRRAVAAGSVYWFEIASGQFDLPTLQKLSCHVWSDNVYDKHDGFGLAVLSAWQAPTQL